MDEQKLYRNRFSNNERNKRLKLWNTLYSSFLHTYIRPTDSVCDIGAGECEFLSVIDAKEKIAVDIQYRTYKKEGQIKKYPSITPLLKEKKNSIDTIMLSNVLEHLVDQEALLMLLSHTKTLLKPDGSILIIQPVVDLTHEKYWDFFDHRLILTRKSLLEALNLTGFFPVEYVPRFLPYTTKTTIPQFPWMVSLYLTLPWYLRPFAGQCFIQAKRI